MLHVNSINTNFQIGKESGLVFMSSSGTGYPDAVRHRHGTARADKLGSPHTLVTRQEIIMGDEEYIYKTVLHLLPIATESHNYLH